ncbi:MAG: hypothetical protein ACHQFW_11515, partial [Chitinophagales bacterium]
MVRNIFNFIVLGLLLNSCKPDPIIIDDDPCYFPAIDFGPWGPTTMFDDVLYLKPCFNPNNNSEFIYVEDLPLESN